MLNKKLSLILLAAAAVVELTSLVWIRGEYRSTMIDGAEYQVPAAIDFKGDFYERNYLPVTVPLTEAPWHGEKAPEKGAEIYLTPHQKCRWHDGDHRGAGYPSRRGLPHHPCDGRTSMAWCISIFLLTGCTCRLSSLRSSRSSSSPNAYR